MKEEKKKRQEERMNGRSKEGMRGRKERSK